ncbi:MAG: trypsin-like peptidase domain-containing protein [Candidatus Koribacter versatilis]|nr:trypsin-like peptidase domain-containing protein [Candidatus Koribacter versatilis]
MINRSVLPMLFLAASLGISAQTVSTPSTSSPQNAATRQQLAPPTNTTDQSMVKLTVKAMVIDRDLNVKPIPKFVFSLEVIGTGATQLFTTKLDGTVEIQVSPGRYRIASAKPLDFESKHYSWDMQFNVGQAGASLELSNDNAKIVEGGPSAVDDLASVFKKYRDTVVTVWAEVGAGHGTGFIADPAGLVITNQHVVTTSEYIAVQFDQDRTLPATVLASDSTKDVAVLWVNFSKTPEAQPAPLLNKGDIPAEEGEKVFTIGSPLHQSKVMTTGIVSKIEPRAIISDVNINHGNSGGPLFNSRGRVIGITTFGDFTRAGGPGIAGIVRIEEAFPLIEQAKAKMGSVSRPSAEFLPNLPTDTYPIEAIKASANIEKFKVDRYIFGVGDYDVAFITPILKYRELAGAVQAGKEKERRNRKHASAVQGTFQPLDELKGWQEYVGEYEPVLLVRAKPRLRETFWSAFARGMAASGGAYYTGPAKMRFKTDFYRMKLFCGNQEVRPLFPGKIQRVIDEQDAFVNITDATFDGFYKYSADAISEKCGTVTLQLFSEREPNQPKVKELDQKTINAVSADFAPYLAQHTSGSKQ